MARTPPRLVSCSRYAQIHDYDSHFSFSFAVNQSTIWLLKDDGVCATLESLAGTLKAAKKRGLVTYKAELLLQGMSDAEVITLKA